MGIEQALSVLTSRFEELRDGLDGLRVTVVEDVPKKPEIALVDQRANTVDDLVGWAEEGLTRAVAMSALVAPSTDWDGIRRELSRSQKCFDELWRRFTTGLACYERMAEVTSVGRREGGEWQGWVKIIRQWVGQSQEAMYNLHGALIGCWEEMAGRSTGLAINVRGAEGSAPTGASVSASERRRVIRMAKEGGHER